MEDFVFGTLATDELRLAHQHRLRSGITHHYARTPYASKPGQPVQATLMLGPQQSCDRAWLYWSNDGIDPAGERGLTSHGQAIAMQKAEAEWDIVEWGYVQHYQATIPAQSEGVLVRYYLTAETADGMETPADGGRYYAYYVTNLGLPEWVRQAVIYQIMPDRFYPGDGKAWMSPDSLYGFFGGTLRGITEKLDYIAGLGANVLWLTPIFPSPSHHGYDATDLFSVEPRLGSTEELRVLIDETHHRDMRILLDFVPNHWSDQHPLFQEAVRDRQSPYVDWYHFKHWPDDYESFFGVKELPQLNLRHPATRQHLLDAAAHWLAFGVDGFRLDYAVGPSPDFWAEFRRTCAAVKPDAWTFGEIVEPPDSQRHFYGLLNGALDFMLLEALRKTFAFHSWDTQQFSLFLERHESYFPDDFSRPSFLDNHDMNRYLWAAGGDRQSLKLAALCQFTLGGPPVIYYGTEVGLSQQRDVRQDGMGLPEESRLPMLWEGRQDLDMLLFYRSLIALRRGEAALRSGTRRTLPAGKGVVAFQRQLGGQELATVININNTPCQVILPGQWRKPVFATHPGIQLGRKGDQSKIDLPAQAGVVLK